MNTKSLYDFNINYKIDKKLSNRLLPLAKKYLSNPNLLTNEWGYKNTYTQDEGLSVEPELEFFVDYILEESNLYFQTKQIKIKSQLKLWTSLFVSEMHEGDEHSIHNHPGALLSGLIYLQVPPCSSNLEFYNPRHSSPAWLNYVEEETYTYEDEVFQIKPDHTIVVNPVSGLFLFWESWAQHRVPINQSKEGRITMVFNVGIDNA